MKIDITIQGITPLICNRFTEEAAERATTGSRSAIATADRGTPQDIASQKLYLDTKGVIGIPVPNLLRCIVDGGIFEKHGRSKITTQKSSLLYACLDIEDVMIPIVHEQPWKVDTRPIRIPATGGRILAHRPMFDDWKLSFTANLDTEIMTPALLRQIVDHAGKKIGLGDFRPSTKGPFGKFVVIRWVVEKVKKLAAAA